MTQPAIPILFTLTILVEGAPRPVLGDGCTYRRSRFSPAQLRRGLELGQRIVASATARARAARARRPGLVP